MINALFSIRAIRSGLALSCLVACGFLAGCNKKGDVWVAGGGFLVHGAEDYATRGTLTLAAQKPALDTQVMILDYSHPELLDELAAVLNGKTLLNSNRLWVPPTTGNLQVIDVSGASPFTPKAVSISNRISIGLAQDDQFVYASDPFDSLISVIDKSKLTLTSTVTMTSGLEPTYLAKGAALYAIVGANLVKFSNTSPPVVLGSSPVDSQVSDLQAKQGFVVATSIGNDKVYVFNDDATTPNPHLWWTLNTQNGSPFRVAISENSPVAYVTILRGTEGNAPGLVDVLDLAGRQVTTHVQVGACPTPIAVSQVESFGIWQDNSVLVGNQCDSTLSRIDISTIPSSDSGPPATVDTITLPGVPNAIATQ